jgi:hypothetical protein
MQLIGGYYYYQGTQVGVAASMVEQLLSSGLSDVGMVNDIILTNTVAAARQQFIHGSVNQEANQQGS